MWIKWKRDSKNTHKLKFKKKIYKNLKNIMTYSNALPKYGVKYQSLHLI